MIFNFIRPSTSLVPSEVVARDAYIDGDIEIDELEELIGAALEGRKVELSLAMQARMYAENQLSVRFAPPYPSTHEAKVAWVLELLDPPTEG